MPSIFDLFLPPLQKTLQHFALFPLANMMGNTMKCCVGRKNKF